MSKDITSYNEQGQQHGYFEVYYCNGQLMFKGNFVNGQPHGYRERYYSNGKLDYKQIYF